MQMEPYAKRSFSRNSIYGQMVSSNPNPRERDKGNKWSRKKHETTSVNRDFYGYFEVGVLYLNIRISENVVNVAKEQHSVYDQNIWELHCKHPLSSVYSIKKSFTGV